VTAFITYLIKHYRTLVNDDIVVISADILLHYLDDVEFDWYPGASLYIMNSWLFSTGTFEYL
jgi:hypothetical protein